MSISSGSKIAASDVSTSYSGSTIVEYTNSYIYCNNLNITTASTQVLSIPANTTAAFCISSNAWQGYVLYSSNQIYLGRQQIGSSGGINYLAGVKSGVSQMWWGTNQSGSSRAYKKHILPLQTATNIINLLHPVSFYYKQDLEQQRYGLIWEDTYQICPEICHKDNKTNEKTICYSELIPYLLKELQDLRLEVIQLEKEK